MYFWKRKKVEVCLIEKSNNEIIDYLGINFYHTGNMLDTVKALNDQALKAYNQLLQVFSRISVDVKATLALFDSLVVPIIPYGLEIWGIYSTPEIDRMYLRFL